jgi:hypothetical protein
MVKWIAIEVPQIYQKETYYDVASIRASQFPLREPQQLLPIQAYIKLDIGECLDINMQKKRKLYWLATPKQ